MVNAIWSADLIFAMWTFNISAGVRWSLQVPYFRLTSLQRVPRRAPPMHCRAMFTHAVTPELLDLVMVSQMVCMCCGGRVGTSPSVEIPVYRAY